MKIYARMKSPAKRRPIAAREYEIPFESGKLKDLLKIIVFSEVDRYNEKNEETVIPFLTEQEIKDVAETGKVSFGSVYNEKKANQAEAYQNALVCFQDGLVRIFQNEKERKDLEEILSFREGDQFLFIRLTFLTGRLW